MPDVLALVGSLRAASYNLALARAAQDAAPPALRLHLAAATSGTTFTSWANGCMPRRSWPRHT